jgi:hypothetical protein
MEPIPQPSLLQRRRIEAEFARALLEHLEPELGRARAAELLGATASSLARRHADALAREHGMEARTLEDMARLLPLWEADGALEVRWLEKGRARLAFDVTRCRYAEMYRELGMADLGAQLSCSRDGAFCAGFNPRLSFERTGTLMAGASRCDFRYTDPREDADAGR